MLNVCLLANTKGITSPSLASGCTEVKPSTLLNLLSALTLAPVTSPPRCCCAGSDRFGNLGFGANADAAKLRPAPTTVVTMPTVTGSHTTCGTTSYAASRSGR